ncbi:MAG TPA: hypothetical protein VD706_03225 [Candidatus Saccharimonadales bacterium]|nr:hypothetical protein [Candidatus Saccharimonadales bacterium]
MSLVETEPGLATTIPGDTPEHPDVQPTVVVELMGDGYAIEKDPKPIASIAAEGVSAEAILQRLFESQEDPESGEDQHEARFTPYSLINEPEDVYGGITVIGGDAERANAFIRKLIGSVERPADEEQGDGDLQEIAASKDSQPDEEAGHSRSMMAALRRSRVGRFVAGAAVVASGSLSWASSASAETLEQTCIEAGMKPMQIKAAKMHGVHKDDGNGWYGRVRGQIDAMPQECTDNGIYRVLNSRVLLQNGEHPQRWSMIYPWSGSEWNGRRNNKGGINNDAGYGVGVGFTNTGYLHNPNWTKWAYICRPGPEKTQARYQEIHTVIQTPGTISEYGYKITGDIEVLAGSKAINRPIKVSGAC